MIASGCMFGPHQRVILQCLDLNLPEVKENMRGISLELQDGNFPLLHKAVFTTDDAEAFRGADYCILLGAFPRQEGRPKSEAMEKNVLIFRTMGTAIQEHVKGDCKILVVGNPAHTNALICAHYAPHLPKENFFALTRLDQNRAAGQISEHLSVSVADVRNVVIWGCHAKFPDVEHSVVRGKLLSQVMSSPEDRNWLNELFRQEMQTRGAAIVKARKASSAMSTARAIVDHIQDLHFGTRPGEFVSMGVWSDHQQYGLAGGLIYSVPVVCLGQGRWRVHSDLKLSQTSKDRLKQVEVDLIAERELAREIFSKHSPSLF
mmetsp:Transcript_48884/g.79320  ORF Transcript_48884/g.79320 Transcript_48884/m.79320 type:complete len:318 (-) Transcript_48884:82-1035(-)